MLTNKMADFRTDLVNELRNQKYYLEQDLVRMVNAPVTSYKGRLEDIKDLFFEIGKINTALAMADAYLPEQKEEPKSSPQPQPTEEGDVVSSQPTPQPMAGQSHGE